MSEAKHTPGPWQFVAADDTPGFREPAAVLIGRVRFEFKCGTTFNSTELDANARLIAAAPDLLDAAITAVNSLNHYAEQNENVQHALKLLNAALAKAGVE